MGFTVLMYKTIKIDVTEVLVNVKDVFGNVKGKKFKFEVAKIQTSLN